MEVVPHSDLMLRSGRFVKCQDRLPVTILGPELLYASENSLRDDNSLHDKLDDENTLQFEDDSHDDLDPDDVLGIVEVLDSVESMKRSFLRDLLEVSNEPKYQHEQSCDVEFDMFPESCRDNRHVGNLCWHAYYCMSELGETALPPMRYTLCDLSTRPRCFHRPSPVLQVFDMKLQTSLLDATTPVEVYGIIAVRDAEDYRRNYLFNRSPDNPLTINPVSDYLRLMSPKRAMSMQFDCLIEVDIRVKMVGNSAKDITLIDGCMEVIADKVCFGTLYKLCSNGPYGIATLDMIIFEYGVEATIQLEFLRVPPGGFDLRMHGYTSLRKNVYAFIDKTRECQSYVSSAGKHPQHFVAAVQIGDELNIDFLEGGQPMVFKAAIHGNQTKLHHFHNGAILSVMVSWSTARW